MNKKTPVFLKDDSFIYFVLILLLIIVFLVEGMYIYVALGRIDFNRNYSFYITKAGFEGKGT